jgi:hypothetical protein
MIPEMARIANTMLDDLKIKDMTKVNFEKEMEMILGEIFDKMFFGDTIRDTITG